MTDQQDPTSGLDLAAQVRLSELDEAALEALVEAGFEPSRVIEPLRERAGRVASLLALTRGPVPAMEQALVDVTMARVMRTPAPVTSYLDTRDGPARLAPDDDEALDAWVMSGFDTARVPEPFRERARRHESLAGLVTGRIDHVGPELADRTLARIQAESDRERRNLDIRTARDRRMPGGLRLTDLVSVAAALAIGAALVWPVLASFREQARRVQCLANLGNTGRGMETYAASNRDALPLVTASLGGRPWWEVGASDAHSNSANLFSLARSGYVSLASLACPGNPYAPTVVSGPEVRDWRSLEEVSYSYQIMFGRERPMWNAPVRTVVLADRSPVVLRAVRGEPIDPMANAPNHGSQGQHVLFNDGVVEWLRTPVLPGGDNIWLPRAIERRLEEMRRGLPAGSLSGTETPAGVDDAFLGP